MTADIEPRSIDLAEEPAFRLAGLEVHPATLEVVADDRREQVEPRVMQVLVALARRRGEVVSRDELNELCWGGRVVGDDAINRCIQRLRKLAQTYGGFTVETVPRVGYRLAEARGRPWTWLLRGRRVLAALVALAIALTLGAGLWAWRDRQTREDTAEPRIAIRTFDVIGGDPQARAFAARLADDVAGVIGENAVGYTLADLALADMVLGGVVSREAGAWQVRVYLEDTRARATLWSQRFERPLAGDAELRGQIAVAIAETLYSLQTTVKQKGLTLDATTRALVLKGSALLSSPQVPFTQGGAVRTAEQIVARAPDFGYGHGMLAVALLGSSVGASPEETKILGDRIRAEAAQAISIDPKTSGPAYDTLFRLARAEAPLELARAEDVLLQGLAADPEFFVIQMRECTFLLEVGRVAEAVRYCERARALHPLAPTVGWRYALALYASGETDIAAQTIERGASFHPDHIQTRRIRFEIEAFHGSTDRARALLRDPDLRPQTFRAEATPALELFLKARRSGAAADTDRAIAALWAGSRAKTLDARYLILGAASLGRLDDAFPALSEFGPNPSGSIAPSLMFEPAAAPLLRDPRFWPVAAKAGYVRYWRTRDRWPDFCSDPTLPFDCRKEAARVAGPEG